MKDHDVEPPIALEPRVGDLVQVKFDLGERSILWIAKDSLGIVLKLRRIYDEEFIDVLISDRAYCLNPDHVRILSIEQRIEERDAC